MDINLKKVRDTSKMLMSMDVDTLVLAEMYMEMTNASELDDNTIKQLLEIGLLIFSKSSVNTTATGVGVILDEIANDVIEDSSIKPIINYNYVLSRYLESDWR